MTLKEQVPHIWSRESQLDVIHALISPIITKMLPLYVQNWSVSASLTCYENNLHNSSDTIYKKLMSWS